MITWKVIEAEGRASEFQEHLVDVFRKYQGMRTDEMTSDGRRAVKVSASAFARHMGIPKMTFHDWLNNTSISHYDRTVACDLETPLYLMGDVKRQLARLLSPVYTLSKFDKARLAAILDDGQTALEEYNR